jgi:hypothetical protein
MTPSIAVVTVEELGRRIVDLLHLGVNDRFQLVETRGGDVLVRRSASQNQIAR